MQGFSESVKEAYELYAQGKVKQALSQLTPGSKYYEYIRIIEALKTDKEVLTKETKDLILELKRTNSYSLDDEVFQSVIDILTKRGEYEFLKELGSNSFGLNFDHQKPYYAQNANKKGDENLGASHWDQFDHFDDKAEIEKVYSSDYAINSLHKSLWNEVDFVKLSDCTIENVMNTLDTAATLSTESFVQRLSEYFTVKFKDPHTGNYYNIPSHF